MAMYDTNIDRAEQNIFRNCVDELWMGGKPQKLKKVQHSTVNRTDESEQDEEESEETVLGGGGDEVSTLPFVYTCGTVSVSSLGYLPFRSSL